LRKGGKSGKGEQYCPSFPLENLSCNEYPEKRLQVAGLFESYETLSEGFREVNF
jgi:hypothetical protein